MLISNRVLKALLLIFFMHISLCFIIAEERTSEEEILAGLSNTIQKAAQDAIPKTVGIRIQVGALYGFGSGAIISSDGLILTCAHVVEAGDSLTVITWDGKRYNAEKLGRNPKNDYALVKINAQGLPFFTLDQTSLKTKDWVIALGHPGGPYKGYKPGIAVGRVKALHKEFPILFAGKYYDDAILSDVPIFGGNSGGPLININGDLIGINAAGMFTGDFAISVPITEIKPDITSLTKGEVVEGKGGGNILELFLKLQEDPEMVDPDSIAKLFKNTQLGKLLLPLQVPEIPPSLGLYMKHQDEGVLVIGTKSGSAGELAGLKMGDLILSINGQKVSSPREVDELVGSLSRRSRAKITLIRDGNERQITVHLDRKFYSRNNVLKEGYKELGRKVAKSTVVLEDEERTIGYGVVIDQSGFILTNYRLIEGDKEVSVRLSNGELTTAQVWGTNQYIDIALLKVDVEEDKLIPISIGDPTKLQAGSWVISGGSISGPLCVGAVASPRRSCCRRRMMPIIPQFWIMGTPNKSPLRLYPEVIQHDTNIEEYQFGSPLVDIDGNLVGINVGHFYPSTTFATPIDLIMKELPDMKARKNIPGPRAYQSDPYQTRDPLMDSINKFFSGLAEEKGGYLGIEIENYIDGDIEGVKIMRVLPGTPASKAGLKEGDVILIIDKEEIVESRVLATMIGELSPNTSVLCTVLREGKTQDITVTVGQRPGREDE